jgi:DNA-binding GntR family transcriptional regulator
MVVITGISRSKPVAEQVENILRDRFLSGSYSPGNRIPSEIHLADEFRVSRSTIRSALAVLAAEGLIRRRQGDGTYAALDPLKFNDPTRRAWKIFGFQDGNNRQETIQRLERGIRLPTAQESRLLKLGLGEKVLSIQYLYLADQKPVRLATRSIRETSLKPNLPPLEDDLSLFDFIAKLDLCQIHSGQVYFKGMAADGINVSNLIIPSGTPVLSIKAIFSDPAEQPILLAEEIYLGKGGYQMSMVLPSVQEIPLNLSD